MRRWNGRRHERRVTIHYGQKVADLFVYQPYLRLERGIVAIGLNKIRESIACATQAVDHAVKLEFHGLAAQSVDVDIPRHGSRIVVRTNIRQRALRKLDGTSNGGSYARHILATAFSVP